MKRERQLVLRRQTTDPTFSIFSPAIQNGSYQPLTADLTAVSGTADNLASFRFCLVTRFFVYYLPVR